MLIEKLELIGKLQEFTEKYKGKTVFFDALTDDEKYLFVVLDGWNYFGNKMAMRSGAALKRAMDNADAHKKNGYGVFTGQKMKIKD